MDDGVETADGTWALSTRIGRRGHEPDPVPAVRRQAFDAAGDVESAIVLARRVAPEAPLPGGGGTAQLWSLLATLGAADLTVARVVEPHLDALAVLAQAGLAARTGAVHGVYAAERPGTELTANEVAGGHRLTGVKPWCSLAGRLDRALVTAHTPQGRRLFDVDLHAPGVTTEPGMWHARGLAAVDSGDVRFDDVPAEPVGDAGWYLRRPGFAWGGIGVAACWFGGAVAVAEALHVAAVRRAPDQLAAAAIGQADRILWTARLALEHAADDVDAGRAVGAAGGLLAARVRGVVAEAGERVLALVGHALGPAPLTLDEAHARRVADLTVYLRQHHAERDDAALGTALLQPSD